MKKMEIWEEETLHFEDKFFLTNTPLGYMVEEIIPTGGILERKCLVEERELSKREIEEAEETEACPTCHCCGVHDHKDREPEEKKKLMNRLKRIEGQIRGIEGMLENNAYCPDILIQVSAVNSALNSFNKELLAQHIKSCVVEDVREGCDDTIDELVKVIQRIMK